MDSTWSEFEYYKPVCRVYTGKFQQIQPLSPRPLGDWCSKSDRSPSYLSSPICALFTHRPVPPVSFREPSYWQESERTRTNGRKKQTVKIMALLFFPERSTVKLNERKLFHNAVLTFYGAVRYERDANRSVCDLPTIIVLIPCLWLVRSTLQRATPTYIILRIHLVPLTTSRSCTVILWSLRRSWYVLVTRI